MGKISREFSRWDEPHAHGPGLYFVVEADAAAAFTEAMGTSRWPVEDCASVFGSPTGLFEAAKEVAFTCDGAVIVHGDATITEEDGRLTVFADGTVEDYPRDTLENERQSE